MIYFIFTDDARYRLTRGRGRPAVPAPFIEKTDCPLSSEWPFHLFESQLACACGSAPKLSVLLHGCTCLSRSHTTESLPDALVAGQRVEATAPSESFLCRRALSYMLAFPGDFRFSLSVSAESLLRLWVRMAWWALSAHFRGSRHLTSLGAGLVYRTELVSRAQQTGWVVHFVRSPPIPACRVPFRPQPLAHACSFLPVEAFCLSSSPCSFVSAVWTAWLPDCDQFLL